MSLFKELISELSLFATTFLGFLSFIIWAWVGRLISVFNQSKIKGNNPFRVVMFITEIPIAIGMGVTFGGITEYLINHDYLQQGSLLQPAIISAGAYLGPKLLEDVWNYWLKMHFGSGTHITINAGEHDEHGSHSGYYDEHGVYHQYQNNHDEISNAEVIEAVKEYMNKKDNSNKSDEDDANQQKDSP